MIKRHQSLAYRSPTVAVQWHPIKNDPVVTPENTAGQSSIRVWWICNDGHEWQEVVSQRVSTASRWKKDDPAACRFCSEPSPMSIVQHTFRCGHTVRVTYHKTQQGQERCWECEKPFYEERKRQRRREAYHANKSRLPMPSTPEQRTAQRQIVALLNSYMCINDTGIFIHRNDQLAEMWGGPGTNEISESLELLGISHDVQVSTILSTFGRTATLMVVVPWSNVLALAKWAPAAVRKAEEARASLN